MQMRSIEIEFFSKVKQCDGSQEGIRRVGDFCLEKGSKFVLPITKLIQNAMQCYSIDYKMKILRIMSELIMRDKSKGFMRHLAPRLLFFIEITKAEILQNQDAIDALREIFKKWRVSKIFALSFYNRLFEQTGSMLKDRLAQNQNHIYTKYSKGFIAKLKDVRAIPIADKIYNCQVQTKLLNKQLQDAANKQTKIFSLQNPQQKAQAKNLLVLTDQLINEHIQLLLSFQQGCMGVFGVMKQEKERLQREE